MNYYIQGNKEKADQIKAAFEKLGYDTSFVQKLSASDSHILFTLPCDTRVHAFHTAYIEADILKRLVGIDPDYKELELPVEPKFKVGDEVKTGNTIDMIAEVGYYTRSYYCVSGRTISFENQDLWHLAPKPHYDIANFKPFDKVLVRDTKYGNWNVNLFSYYIDDIDARIVARFRCINSTWIQCIPFEGNEHLLGTTDMCDEMYINW